MNEATATIKSMQNHFTIKERQYIAEALEHYNRIITTKPQQRHDIEKLHQIFSLSTI